MLPFLVWSSPRSSFGLPMYKMDDVCRRGLLSPLLSRKLFSCVGTAGLCIPCCVLVFGRRTASSTRLCHDTRGVYPLITLDHRTAVFNDPGPIFHPSGPSRAVCLPIVFWSVAEPSQVCLCLCFRRDKREPWLEEQLETPQRPSCTFECSGPRSAILAGV